MSPAAGLVYSAPADHCASTTVTSTPSIDTVSPTVAVRCVPTVKAVLGRLIPDPLPNMYQPRPSRTSSDTRPATGFDFFVVGEAGAAAGVGVSDACMFFGVVAATALAFA